MASTRPWLRPRADRAAAGPKPWDEVPGQAAPPPPPPRKYDFTPGTYRTIPAADLGLPGDTIYNFNTTTGEIFAPGGRLFRKLDDRPPDPGGAGPPAAAGPPDSRAATGRARSGRSRVPAPGGLCQEAARPHPAQAARPGTAPWIAREWHGRRQPRPRPREPGRGGKRPRATDAARPPSGGLAGCVADLGDHRDVKGRSLSGEGRHPFSFSSAVARSSPAAAASRSTTVLVGASSRAFGSPGRGLAAEVGKGDDAAVAGSRVRHDEQAAFLEIGEQAPGAAGEWLP